MNMAEKQKKKKDKKKRSSSSIFKKVMTVVLLPVSAYLIFTVVQECMTTVKLHQQLAEVQAKLQEVKDENTYLTQQKEKLQDPDYVESYARGNYQLSKDGEQIFYLPEKTDK